MKRLLLLLENVQHCVITKRFPNSRHFIICKYMTDILYYSDQSVSCRFDKLIVQTDTELFDWLCLNHLFACREWSTTAKTRKHKFVFNPKCNCVRFFFLTFGNTTVTQKGRKLCRSLR